MNIFQKQLVMNDGRALAEIDGRPKKLNVGPPLPPQRISIEEFEDGMSQVRAEQEGEK